MKKKILIISGVVVVVILAIIGFNIWRGNQPTDYGKFARSTIEKLMEERDYTTYKLDTIIDADENSGYLSEHVEGNMEAPIIIYEYADYQCSGCAYYNDQVNELLSKYDGKIAIVFRNYLLSYHNNAVQASSAAIAADIQGYWAPFKDLLFKNQNDWFYSGRKTFQEQLESYFLEASGGAGDLEKFRADMKTEAVAKRVAYEYGLGKARGITATPTFYINGQDYEFPEVEDAIKKLLEEKDAKKD